MGNGKIISLWGIFLGCMMPLGAVVQTTEWTRFKLILDLHRQDHPQQSCVMIIDEQNPERAFALIGGNLVDMPSGVQQYRIPMQQFDHFLKNLPAKAIATMPLDLGEDYWRSVLATENQLNRSNNRDIWMLTYCPKKSVLKKQVAQKSPEGSPIIFGAEKKDSDTLGSKLLQRLRKTYTSVKRYIEKYVPRVQTYFNQWSAAAGNP